MIRQILIGIPIGLLSLIPLALLAGEPQPEDAAAVVPAEGAEAPKPLFEQDEVDFNVVLVAAEGEAVVLKVSPKAPFHINQEYPWKFQAGEDTFKRETFSLSEAQATLSLPKATAGLLRFSVCNDSACLIKKVEGKLD